MYAMIYELRFWPHITDEEIEALYKTLIGWFREAPGYLGATLFHGDTSSEGLIITNWTDATSAYCAWGIHLCEIACYVNPLIRTPPGISGYTVLAQDDAVHGSTLQLARGSMG